MWGCSSILACHNRMIPYRCHELLSTSFETIGRSVLGQLAGTRAGGGFPRHAYWYSPLFDRHFNEGEEPHIRGRKRFGRITIANGDAGANTVIETAIDEVHRAVEELAGWNQLWFDLQCGGSSPSSRCAASWAVVWGLRPAAITEKIRSQNSFFRVRGRFAVGWLLARGSTSSEPRKSSP